jgi:predicted transcriptional regulator
MSRGLVESIKTRVPKGSKRALDQIAKERHLDLSDIVREALREYLMRRTAEPQKQAA